MCRRMGSPSTDGQIGSGSAAWYPESATLCGRLRAGLLESGTPAASWDQATFFIASGALCNAK
jgi:hypothetical protein